MGNIKAATTHWKKRYEHGDESEYWWEVAYQHLLKLGTYPEVRKEIFEIQAARLSREILYKREEERTQDIKNAENHIIIGKKAFAEGDYAMATEEFRKALALVPVDDNLSSNALNLYKRSARLLARDRVEAVTKSALEYMDKEDFSSAQRSLEKALNEISRIAQEN